MSTITDADSLIGMQLAGRYRVIQRVAAGAMGAVYEAVQEDLGRRVAIKVLSLSPSPSSLARFRIEAEAAASLGNPHIVQVSDFQSNPGEPPFLVMELLSGQSLRELCAREGPLPWQRAGRIGLQILAALSAAHTAKIVHRDIKPANIFMVSSAAVADFVKVVDFGVAKLLEPQPGSPITHAGAIIGTVAYMSPEQARGEVVDERSDLYSVAVCLYEAVSGRRPIEVAAPLLRAAIAAAQPVLLEERCPEIDLHFAQIIACAMQRDPSQRYASAGEMADALARIVGVNAPFAPETRRDSAAADTAVVPSVGGPIANTITAAPSAPPVAERTALSPANTSPMSSPQVEAPPRTEMLLGPLPPAHVPTAFMSRGSYPHPAHQASVPPPPRPRPRPKRGGLWWLFPVAAVVMLPIVVIVLAVGVLVLIGDAVQTKQRAFVAKVPPTACPAPARCTGTLDIIDDHYLVCQPLAFKSYREGDVLFVKEGAGNVAPVQLVSAGDAGVFKARDYEGDTATLSIEAIQGRRCVP